MREEREENRSPPPEKGGAGCWGGGAGWGGGEDGSGPDPERLFDRFYQGGPARAGGGAGLGLSIVGELMERMGGRASAGIAGGRLEIRLSFRSA